MEICGGVDVVRVVLSLGFWVWSWWTSISIAWGALGGEMSSRGEVTQMAVLVAATDENDGELDPRSRDGGLCGSCGEAPVDEGGPRAPSGGGSHMAGGRIGHG